MVRPVQVGHKESRLDKHTHIAIVTIASRVRGQVLGVDQR